MCCNARSGCLVADADADTDAFIVDVEVDDQGLVRAGGALSARPRASAVSTTVEEEEEEVDDAAVAPA